MNPGTPQPIEADGVLRNRYCGRLPARLEDLEGPAGGTVNLPLHVVWSALSSFSLDRPKARMSLYRTVLAEGQREDVVSFLNGDLLVAQWPVLRRLVSGSCARCGRTKSPNSPMRHSSCRLRLRIRCRPRRRVPCGRGGMCDDFSRRAGGRLARGCGSRSEPSAVALPGHGSGNRDSNTTAIRPPPSSTAAPTRSPRAGNDRDVRRRHHDPDGCRSGAAAPTRTASMPHPTPPTPCVRHVASAGFCCQPWYLTSEAYNTRPGGQAARKHTDHSMSSSEPSVRSSSASVKGSPGRASRRDLSGCWTRRTGRQAGGPVLSPAVPDRRGSATGAGG